MEKLKKIPDAELEVMQVIWSNPCPITTKQVKDILEQSRPWKTGALQTLLNRLIERGYLEAGSEGKNKTYSPLVSEENYLALESRSFLKRFFSKSITKLVASLYDSKAISAEDLKELNRYIDNVTSKE